MILFIHVPVHFIIVHSEKELSCTSDIEEGRGLPVTRGHGRGRGRHQTKAGTLLNY